MLDFSRDKSLVRSRSHHLDPNLPARRTIVFFADCTREEKYGRLIAGRPRATKSRKNGHKSANLAWSLAAQPKSVLARARVRAQPPATESHPEATLPKRSFTIHNLVKMNDTPQASLTSNSLHSAG